MMTSQSTSSLLRRAFLVLRHAHSHRRPSTWIRAQAGDVSPAEAKREAQLYRVRSRLAGRQGVRATWPSVMRHRGPRRVGPLTDPRRHALQPPFRLSADSVRYGRTGALDARKMLAERTATVVALIAQGCRRTPPLPPTRHEGPRFRPRIVTHSGTTSRSRFGYAHPCDRRAGGACWRSRALPDARVGRIQRPDRAPLGGAL
jgi:hypothetical protein